MYNLSPRMGEVVHSQTTELVGPNTYVLCNATPQYENYAPFLSLTPRESSFIKKCFTEAIYDTSDANKSVVKGCSSPRNKAERFAYRRDDDLPSPTRYNPKRPGKGVKREPVSKGSYYRAVCSEGISCPSIPAKKDVNGYVIENGRLIKVPPEEHDTTLGPAFYSIEHENFYKKRYGGCKWSAYRSQRSSYKIQDGPGPAHYTVKAPVCRKSQCDECYREMARLLTFIPRYSEAQEIKTCQEGLPGPGDYETRIDKDHPRSKSICHRPFITGKKRFQYLESDSPSPGDYDIPDSGKRDFSILNVPFGMVCPRFESKVPFETPGPSSYIIKSPLLEKVMSKKNPYSLVNPPFNKTSRREVNPTAPDAECTPSAADYMIRKAAEEPADVHSSVFKSKVPRFTCKGTADRKGPASYNIREQFNKNKNRISHNVGKVAFLTTGPRSTFARVKYITPGPGQYMGKKMKKQEGYYFKTTPRFEPDPEPRPGPTTYTLHPSNERSLYKAYYTHNLRLKENVLNEKLRLPPSATFSKWAENVKARKQLRCFSNGFYMHCESP